MGDPTDTPSSAAVAPTLPEPHALPDGHVPNAPRVADPSSSARTAAASAASETVESHFWLTRTDQVAFGVLSVIALALLAVYWIRLSNWGTRTVEIERLPSRQYEFRIDANAATWVEWGQIQGIGDALARRIVADREQNGRFRTVDDLARVRGIGPKTLEHLRPWVRVDDEESQPAAPVKRKRSKSRSKTSTKISQAE